ncbi:MAG: NADH-quinone oxidoreductase subunit NuoE [Halanaerobiales bacterium]
MTCNCGQNKMDKYLKPLDDIFKNYSKDEKYLIPILQDAQDEYGYLPEDVLKEIACNLNLSLSQVFGVVTFYSQFHLEPRGENIIRVCTGTACHVRGGAEVLDQLKEELNIDSGETTENLSFTLETVACIGACGLAPVIMINDDTYGRMNAQEVPEVLANYQE